nr:MAG: chloride channel protein [Pseudomonadota bacterium]
MNPLSPLRMRRLAAQISDWLVESREGLLSLVAAESAPLDLRLVGRTLGHAAIVGLAAGLVGAAFFAVLEYGQWFLLEVLAGYEPLRAHGERIIGGGGGELRPWLLVLLPALGGLGCGLLSLLAPEIRGGGGNEAIAAFHLHDGKIRRRVLWLRPAATFLTLSTGGAGGREGPIMHVGGAIGSWVASLLRLGPRERRILLVAGIAAGISALFRTPLGAAILAVEVLYRDGFESDALIPAVFSSVIAYSVVISIFGESTLFAVGQSFPFYPRHLVYYAALAIVIALAAVVFLQSLDAVRRVAKRLPGPAWLRPAWGGLALGAMVTALLLLAREEGIDHGLGLLGGGYGAVQAAIDGADWLGAGWRAVVVLSLMALGKILAASITIGSGGSAGDFAPSLAIGGLLGGAFGFAAQLLFDDAQIQPAAFALVGMGAFYGGIAHAPLAALVLVCEMAGNYDLLVPLMLALGVVYVALRKRGLYSAQPATQRDSPVYQESASRSLLASATVEEAMSPAAAPAIFDRDTSAPEMIRHHGSASWQEVFPVRGEDGSFVGMVSAETVRLLASQPDVHGWTTAGDLMEPLVFVRPSDDLRTAAERLVTTRVRALPVIDASGRLVGFLDQVRIAETALGLWRPARRGERGAGAVGTREVG